MEKNWRLCGTLIAAITDNTKVLFVDPDQKGYTKEVNKIIKNGGQSITLENNGFSVRICNDIVYVNHPNLPNECVLVNSAELKDLIYIISHTTVNNGIFDGHWSFLVDIYKNFLPARDGISLYEKAELEMIRKFSLVNGKKTSSWEPGYCYYNETETLYYLGTVRTWRKDSSSIKTEFGTIPGNKEYHMTLSSEDYKPTGFETLEEVIKNNFYKIKFSEKRNKMVASTNKFATGEVKEMVPLWEDIINNWRSENFGYINKYSNLVCYKSEITNLFSLFEYTKDGEDFFNFSSEGKNILREILKDEMKYLITTYWGYNTYHLEEGPSPLKSNEQNINVLTSGIFEIQHNCQIYNRVEYYTQMMNMIGISLRDIAKEVVNEFNPANLINSWKNYVNNLSYVENENGLFTSAVINKSSDRPDGYYSSNTVEYDDLTTDQKELLEDAVNFCRNTSKDCSEYLIKNIGTLSKPKYVEVFNITIDTINRMYKDTEIPEKIQQILIKDRFTRITIKLDKK
jgi:hypothetical protein